MIDFFTPTQVAARFGVHPATVRRWLSDGTLRGEKIAARAWVIPEDALDGFQPPARGPKPAADGRRLLDQAREMVAADPRLLNPEHGEDGWYFDAAVHELARKAGPVNLERCRRALAHAIMQARERESANC